jgi:hypothetical protein
LAVLPDLLVTARVERQTLPPAPLAWAIPATMYDSEPPPEAPLWVTEKLFPAMVIDPER